MSTPKDAARVAEDSTAFEVIARIGYIVLGVFHIVIGAIAISIANGGGGEADQGGALGQIRNSPAGIVLLWAIVIGLTALAIWQIAETFLANDADAKKRWGHRLKYIGTAVIYVAIAVTALIYALGGESDSSQSSQSLSAKLLATPGGVAVLIIIGVGIFALGVAFVVRGFTRAFEKHLKNPGGVVSKGVVTFGVVGYVAKGVAIGVTGILFVVAALTHDPEKAGGLDAGLHALAALPFGSIILWIVGAGLVIYGVYCFFRARYARM